MTLPDAGLPDSLAVPDPGRLDPARPDYQAILAAHRRALDAGEDGYLDPATGRWSFTAGLPLGPRHLLRQRLPPLPLRQPGRPAGRVVTLPYR